MLSKPTATQTFPKYTVIVACDEDFDPKLSNAAQTTRLGYCHGFPQIGVDAALVQYHSLVRYAESVENPIFWLTCYDYDFLSNRELNLLKDYPHIVQVNTWFEGMEEVHERFNAPGPTISKRAKDRMAYTAPSFVWCSAPEAYFHSYEGWIEEMGFKLVSLPWACDIGRYYPCPGVETFAGTEVAFVGGYRGYKEPQYQEYLWPYEGLKVWGYSTWPRCYQGYLDNNEEKYLYQNALVCPTLSEPQFPITGDTVERPFKILGSGGLTVFDCNPAYTHLFHPSEVLIPETPRMYHEFMQAVLNKVDLNQKYRLAGYKAVIERHTYAHRARKIMKELGL